MTSAPERSRPKFPEIIETARLSIRFPQSRDGAEMNAAIRETYDDLHVWMDWADHVPSVEETESFCKEANQKFRDGTDFTLRAYLKDSLTLVLATGLHPRDWDVPKFEIGYWCRASFQGKG